MSENPMSGTWTLTAPNGQQYTGPSPIHCVRAELDDRVPPSVQLARIVAFANEPDFAERHVRLGEFYSAGNVDELIDKMEAYIERLQAKLLQIRPSFDFAPMPPRG